jgi:hypothetical protein
MCSSEGLQRIPEVKKKAFDFAMDVIEDVNRMAVAFGKGTASDDLLVESWGDLKAMRYLLYFFILIIQLIVWYSLLEISWTKFVNGHIRQWYLSSFS